MDRHRKQLEVGLNPEMKPRGEVLPLDVRKVIVVKEEQQEWSSSLDQEDPEPPHIKEEQEELWTSQGEQLQGLEEDDITKFPFTAVPVKSEDDEEKAQSSQLHQRQTEDFEGPEPGSDTDAKTADSSVAEIEVSCDDWEDTREPQSGLNSSNNDELPVSDSICSTGEKPFSCSECGKRFGFKKNLKRHMVTHTGEKPFNCPVCGKRFIQKVHLTYHMTHHTGEKLFSCSVCNKRFGWQQQLKRHKCVGYQSSRLHHTQSEENREAEPPASSSTEHVKTGAGGEDCEGPEPARNSDPDRHPEPDTDDKTGDSSEPETDDSDDWGETREPQSGLNSLNNDEVPVVDLRCTAGEKPFRCYECGKIFGFKKNLKRHMVTHTGEKPFNCPVCGKRFIQKVHLTYHMTHHTGEKLFSCSVCNQRFSWLYQLKRHKCVGQQSSQLHETEENKEADLPSSSSTEHIKTEADGEDCGGPEPARNSNLDRLPGPDTDDIDDWKETREPQSGLNSLNYDEDPVSDCAGEKPFRCSECGKIFGTKGNLKRHVRTHTEEKPFVCPVCEKTFTQRGYLQKHTRTHTVEKPFSCSVCKKYFTQRGYLQKHMRVHKGEKPYNYSVGGKIFSKRYI